MASMDSQNQKISEVIDSESIHARKPEFNIPFTNTASVQSDSSKNEDDISPITPLQSEAATRHTLADSSGLKSTADDAISTNLQAQGSGNEKLGSGTSEVTDKHGYHQHHRLSPTDQYLEAYAPKAARRLRQVRGGGATVSSNARVVSPDHHRSSRSPSVSTLDVQNSGSMIGDHSRMSDLYTKNAIPHSSAASFNDKSDMASINTSKSHKTKKGLLGKLIHSRRESNISELSDSSEASSGATFFSSSPRSVRSGGHNDDHMALYRRADSFHGISAFQALEPKRTSLRRGRNPSLAMTNAYQSVVSQKRSNTIPIQQSKPSSASRIAGDANSSGNGSGKTGVPLTTFSLDTDLEHMGGIINHDEKSEAAHHDALPSSMSRAVSIVDLSGEGAWTAPESWDVKNDSGNLECDSENLSEEVSDSEELSDSRQPQAKAAELDNGAEKSAVTGGDGNVKDKKKDSSVTQQATGVQSGLKSARSSVNKSVKYHTIRVFREDGTSTLSCPFDITAAELVQLIGKKLFLPSVAKYQIFVKIGNLTKALEPNEHPIRVQNRLLLFTGYTEKDNLNIIGREDLSYLCRFIFAPKTIKNLTPEQEERIAMDFTNVNLQDMELTAIPITVYKHASEIDNLDLSFNPSVFLPSDFIQSCRNIRRLCFVGNRAGKFPMTILQAESLVSLNLERNFIKELPDQISRLSQLTSLELKCNMLSTLPDSFSKLSSLRYLNISSNHFRHFPLQITKLSQLLELDLSSNEISEIPDEIGLLSSIETINLSTNRLTGSLPKSFEKLERLKRMDLRYNELQNIDVLGQLTNLEHLLLSKNIISTFANSMDKLQTLCLDRNPLTNLQFQASLPLLTELNLSKAKLTSFPDNFFECMTSLESLILDRNHFVSLPPQIGLLRRLRTLSCFSNNLQSLPPQIAELQSLISLDLHGNNIRELPEELWYLGSLRSLNISSNLLDSFPKPPAKLSHFQSNANSALKLDGLPEAKSSNSSVSQPSSKPDGTRDSSVSSLDTSREESQLTVNKGSKVAENYSFTPEPEGSTLGNTLTYLSIADNSMTDDDLGEIAHLHKLVILNLSHNDLMDIPYGILSQLSDLKELYLSGNNFTSLPADELELLQSLRVLHLNNNRLHTLPAELGKIKHLSVLDVGCNSLKYNIANWPYDWNWNWNLDLKYLNFSGNKRLEIKNSHVANRENVSLSDFTALKNLRILGLMDVTLTTTAIPDQGINCRVRTSATELINGMAYGFSDWLGMDDFTSIRDVISERFRGNEEECFIAVFDGKFCKGGGHKISKILQEQFSSRFAEELNKIENHADLGVSDAMRRTLLAAHREIGSALMVSAEEKMHFTPAQKAVTKNNLDAEDAKTGASATIIYIKGKKVYIGNVGDTIAFLSKSNGNHQDVTTRHDPTSPSEFERIRASGGFVSSDGKLDGVCSISRGVGFFPLLPHISAGPAVYEFEITLADEMLVIGTAHLWEYVPYQIAADVIRSEKDDPMRAAAKLRDFAIAYGASEKIVVVVLALNKKNRRRKNETGSGSTEEPSTFKKRNRDRNLLPQDSSLARLGGEIDPPVGQVALVFTDIKNSTLLWDTYPVAMRSAIKTHNEIMRRQLRIVGGYEVKTEGDAFMVSFSTPTAALLWCFSVQSQLLVADWPAEIVGSSHGCEIIDDDGIMIYRGLSVRMGAHWGYPVCERDPITRRMDYFGPMVNRASRVSSTADGGQIALSSDFVIELKKLQKTYWSIKDNNADIADAYEDDLPSFKVHREMDALVESGWIIEEVGEMKLKGLESPELISMVYPKALAGRIAFHMAEAEAMVQGEVVEERKGIISVDSLKTLATVTLRLEQICSFYNGSRVASEISSSLATVPPKAECIRYFDHLVTRLENCITVLTLRQMTDVASSNGLILKGSSGSVQLDLSAILDSLKRISLTIENS